MANEFKIRNGLIVTGSMNVSESIYAPNLAPETNPAYYITWRQSDGRFEVSPAGASGNVNAIGCWDYAGYSTTPTTGEFTIRGNGTSILDSNTTYFQFNKLDNTSVDQSVYFNNIGIGSILTITTGGVTIKYTVTGFNLSGNLYSFSVKHLSGGPSTTLSVGAEACLTLTAVTAGSSITTGTSGTSGGGGGTLSSTNCITYAIDNNFSDVNGSSQTAIFNVSPGWAQPFGSIGPNTVGMYASQTPLAGGSGGATVFFGITNAATFGNPKLFELSYLNLKTTFLISIALGTSPGGGNLGTNGNTIYLNMTFVSGDTGYIIPTGDSFTLCSI
jgi:hypothetical protein